MSITASGTFAATVEGVEVPQAFTLTVAVPVSGYGDFSAALESGTLNRSLTTDLTDGLRTEAGYSKADATFVLSGMVGADETKSAAWFFNPNDPTSPMYRQSVKGLLVTLNAGVQAYGAAAELLQVFTGRVSSVTLDHAGGTATLDVVDLASDWGVLPSVPSVITAPPYNAGLTSEFILELIARNMPTSPRYTRPTLRPKAILAVGARTSLWPEVGSLNTAYSWPVPTFAPCVNGSGLTAGAIAYTPSSTPSVNSDVVIEFWANGTTGQAYANVASDAIASPSLYLQLQVDYDANTVTAQAIGAGPNTYTVSGVADGAHYLAAHFTSNGSGWNVTVRIDGTSHTGTVAAPIGGGTTFTRANVDATGNATIEAIQITTEANPSWNDAFTPTAFIDPSLNPLQVPPPIDAGAQAWDVVQQIAAAELGYARFDGAGNFRFTNRANLAEQSAFRQVRSDASLKTLQTVVGDFAEYQRVQVDYTDWRFKNTGTVFAPQVAWKCPAHSTQTWLRDLGGTVAAAVVSPAVPWTSDDQGGEPTDKTASYFRASTDKYGKNEHSYDTLTVTISMVTPSRIAVTVQNTGSADAWLVSPANYLNMDVGAPALFVRGTPVVTDSPTILEATYDPAGDLYQAPTNAYRQDRDTAQAVAQYLLEQLHAAIPDYQGVDIIPDPRIEVGDKITLVDPDLSKVASADVIVWGSRVSFGFGAWSQTLDVRAIAPPGAWLLGVAGASELGDGAAVTGTAYLY